MKRFYMTAVCVCASFLFSSVCFAESREEFLNDMTAGQTARWEITDNATEDQLADMSFRYVYLDAELEYIGKYKDAEFDNEKFGELARLYVSGVSLQREAVGFYEDYPYVFENEWSTGYMMRAYATVDLHDYYGLSIADDKLEECRNYIAGIGAEQAVTLTEYGRTLETEHLLDLEDVSVSPFNQDYDSLKIKVRSTAEIDVRDMSLNVNLLDGNGDIIQNLYFRNNGILSSGQGVTLTGTFLKEGADAIEFMSMSYTKEDGTYVDNTLDGFGKISLSALSGKGEASHETESSASQTEPTGETEISSPQTETVQETSVSAGDLQVQVQTEQSASPTASDPSDGEKKAIETAIRNRVKEQYSGTDVDRITVNEDYGTEDNPDDWVVLVYLTWNVHNSPETSEKVLKMYSDDIAVLLYNQFNTVQEVAVFWHVPNLTDNTSKWSYERGADGMYQTDNMLGW